MTNRFEQLKKLQEKDIPVLWRPLHEASGGWFWWGASGPEPYIRLYRLLYKRANDTFTTQNCTIFKNMTIFFLFFMIQQKEVVLFRCVKEKHSDSNTSSHNVSRCSYSRTGYRPVDLLLSRSKMYFRKELVNMAKKRMMGKRLHIYYIILGGTMLIHLFYIFYFYTAGSHFMSIFNIGSVIFYNILLAVFMKRKYLNVLVFLFIEVCLHSFFASIVLGMNNGFELFIICVVFASFFLERVTKASMKVIYSLITTAFITLMGMRFLPLCIDTSSLRVYPSEKLLSMIFVFNAIVSFVMVICFLMVYLSDVEKGEKALKRRNYRLSELAEVDSLTNLLNRRAMKKKLQDASRAKLENDIDFVIAIADIDNFKQLNDQYGHACGDLVIQTTASIIKEAVYDAGYVSRWGGDEILILLNGASEDEVIACLNKIQLKLSSTPIHFEDEVVNVTMTVGMCSSNQFNQLQDILSEADRQLYHGKQEGKNCVFWSKGSSNGGLV